MHRQPCINCGHDRKEHDWQNACYAVAEDGWHCSCDNGEYW